ncbi:M13 family metallopeptidase N-terminal domain-containing protein [Sphingopyxis sp. PET50]|uniref:M13 family metallopeptidase N-terminal domain-containing protein n=1 Tax=Sphingopyxis sp. PET50 TaxID=2976533 RepID=UPI0021AF7F6B|nr:M13 family metallopeptidase N-terminal domain-containing protein [Sphingopyxis sp. PET50]
MRRGSTGTPGSCGAGIALQKRIIVNETTAVRDIAALYARTPLETLKLWQQFHVADQAAPYLSKAFVDSRFDYTKVLSGVSELRPRWKRGLTLVDGSLGELVGETYSAQYFPASAKAKMEALVANLKLAMGDRIRANGWMAPSHQAGGAREARQDGRHGRLSRQMARLFGAEDRPRRPLRQCEAQQPV